DSPGPVHRAAASVTVTGLTTQPGRERVGWNKTARIAIHVVYERLPDRIRDHRNKGNSANCRKKKVRWTSFFFESKPMWTKGPASSLLCTSRSAKEGPRRCAN